LINDAEASLADGQHVEALRFQELVKLWSVPADRLPDLLTQGKIAAELDHLPDGVLAEANKATVSELHHTQKLALCRKCAALIAERLKVHIPDSIVEAEVKRAIAYLDIMEAYIYRDWQVAIGDLMIQPAINAARRFDVIGFGEFEERYVAAQSVDVSEVAVGALASDRRWFSRLESLIHGLDMSQAGIFDARREQVSNLYKAADALKASLEKSLKERV